MTSASSTAYFSELSLFTEGNNCSNHTSDGWKGPVYNQANADRTARHYDDNGYPIHSSYQLERYSYETPPSLRQNPYDFYIDKISPEGNKLAGDDFKFKGSNPEVNSSKALWPGSDEPAEKDILHHQAQKQSQISETLNWLSENYEKADGVCLPRCVLYSHYLDFCKKHSFTPAGAATFGKIIRQKFPKLTTRRLGTRGQSKYHYYGIGIKETSVYYQAVYSGKGLTRFSGVKIKTEGSSRKYSLSSKTGTLLPDFPNVESLCLPDGVNRGKLRTFIMMYRTHCQRILDTVISGNFEEVQNFLLHFWQGMPSHLDEIFQSDVTNDIIALCDLILYKAIIDVLIPTTIQDLPETLGNEVKLFIKSLPVWLDNSLENMPQQLQDIKQKVVQGFIQSIRRQLSFVKLAQTRRKKKKNLGRPKVNMSLSDKNYHHQSSSLLKITRTVLQNSDNVQKMVRDALRIDFMEISCQTVYMSSLLNSQQQKVITDYYEEFLSILQHQSSVESFTEWMDNILDRCVMQPSTKIGRKFNECSADFLLHWAAIVSLITKDLTLQNSLSFGSFHLMRMMLDEYIFLVIETKYDAIRESYLQNNIKRLMKNTDEISMGTHFRTSSCRHHNAQKPRRLKYESFEEDPGIHPLSRVQRHEDKRIMSVGSILTPKDIQFSSLPNIGLRSNPPFYCSAITKHHNALVEDARPMQMTPLRYHNHQHHHHHHHHHHLGYPALSSTRYDITEPYLTQYGNASFTDYASGTVQKTNCIAKAVDKCVDNTRNAGRVTDALTHKIDPGNRLLPNNSSYELRANSYSSYNSCYRNMPRFEAYNMGVPYADSRHPEASGHEAYEPALSYYSRCLDSRKGTNPDKSNSYTASFMEIVQPDSERDYSGIPRVQQDIFKAGAHYSSAGW